MTSLNQERQQLVVECAVRWGRTIIALKHLPLRDWLEGSVVLGSGSGAIALPEEILGETSLRLLTGRTLNLPIFAHCIAGFVEQRGQRTAIVELIKRRTTSLLITKDTQAHLTFGSGNSTFTISISVVRAGKILGGNNMFIRNVFVMLLGSALLYNAMVSSLSLIPGDSDDPTESSTKGLLDTQQTHLSVADDESDQPDKAPVAGYVTEALTKEIRDFRVASFQGMKQIARLASYVATANGMGAAPTRIFAGVNDTHPNEDDTIAGVRPKPWSGKPSAKVSNIVEPTVMGSMSLGAVRPVVRAHFARMRTCYQAALGRSPAAQGTISIRFIVDERGAVEMARLYTGTPDPLFNSCIVMVFASMTFPEPDNGKVLVTYPVHFDP